MYRIKEKMRFESSFLKADTSVLSQGTAVAVNGAGQIAALVIAGPLADTEKVTVELFEANSASGTGATLIEGATYEFTSVGATSKKEFVVECYVTDLKSTTTHVVPKVKGSSSTLVSVMIALDGNRFKPENDGVVA